VVVLRLSDPGHVHISAGWLDAHVAEAVIEAVDTGKLIAAIRRRQKLARPRKVSEIEARIELLEDAFYVQGKVPQGPFRAPPGRAPRGSERRSDSTRFC